MKRPNTRGPLSPRQLLHRAYLRTDHWKKLREKALKRDGHQCLACGGTERLQVHHKRYRATLEETKLRDLETLCNTCHRIEHLLPVILPIDRAAREITTEINWERRPTPEMWKKFKSAFEKDPESDASKHERFSSLMIQYSRHILKFPSDRVFAIRDSILCRVPEYAHLAKDSEWKKQFNTSHS